MTTSEFKRPYTYEETVALCKRVHGTAREKGWWPNTVNGEVVLEDGELEEKLVLVASELIEAFEAYRDASVDIKKIYAEGSAGRLPWEESELALAWERGEPLDTNRPNFVPKPEGFPVEMADAYIRVLDLMGATGSTIEPITLDDLSYHSPGEEIGIGFHKALRLVATAHLGLSYWLSRLLLKIEMLCHDLGADLKAALELKARYNDTRPFRHGNKRA